MMQDTAMNSAQAYKKCDEDNENLAQDTMNVLSNLERFLPQSNHIMVDLKLRLIDQVIVHPDLREGFEEVAINFCFELLKVARIVAPGKSKLRGE